MQQLREMTIYPPRSDGYKSAQTPAADCRDGTFTEAVRRQS